METDSLISSYSFDLPPERIAQRPANRRDASRLMLLRKDGTTEDRIFSDLPELLEPGDILIRNNARVLRSRLIGKRRGGGAAEILVVRRDDGDGWRLGFASPGPPTASSRGGNLFLPTGDCPPGRSGKTGMG
jgi:S-adenosylmethionine:tRNA ribosyltransferase-isomerase